MKRTLITLALLLLSVAPSIADERPNPLDQRVALQIGQLVLQTSTQAVQIEQLTQATRTAQARVKELEERYEPKPAEPKASGQ